MSLSDSIIGLYEAASGTQTPDPLRDYLMRTLQAEKLVGDLVQERFTELLPRLLHLCTSPPRFQKLKFVKALRSTAISAETSDDLASALLPLLRSSVVTPGASNHRDELVPIYASILNSAVHRLWRVIAAINPRRHKGLDQQVIEDFRSFAKDISQQIHNSLLDKAPPPEHVIDNETHVNPFLLVRAEDFNHNYARLARLFQDAPEFASISSRTDNVFIEGGRGTGKSMILRRLTAQATLAASRLAHPYATFANVSEDYFGVYVKLTRGYYDQFEQANLDAGIAGLLAQHEINIEVFDAFVDALAWLQREGGLPLLEGKWDNLSRTLSSLFRRAEHASSLEGLTNLIRWEQDQILDYLSDVTFGSSAHYRGSAQSTVGFMRELSRLFRSELFPQREMRLFLMFDEYETLTIIQQKAVNTLMKMRLPDLTIKVGVRKAGRRTEDTFTEGDPIQQPRDYTEFQLDYDVRSRSYATLLAGIATMRLREARYSHEDIESYLGAYDLREEASEAELESELQNIWKSGTRRRNVEMNEEFRQKYTWTAVYRLRTRKNKRKLFFGFDQFALLSSGITSNFIELCKYAFYFALAEGIPLKDSPRIPPAIQTDAVYAVSQRLFGTIDGNVPTVGAVLQRLLTDLGSILRARLLHHSSDPEANRISIDDYEQVDDLQFEQIASVLQGAEVWSVLHLEPESESFRPRNRRQLRAAEFLINRIYCPALGLSPRARWRTPIKLSDLAALIDPNRRKATYARLAKSLSQSPSDMNDFQASFLEVEP